MVQNRSRKPRKDKPRPDNPGHKPVENPRPPGQRGQGPKPIEFTDDQRRLVESAAGIGLRHDLIARLVINPKTNEPINRETLELRFKVQLDAGKAKAHFNVGKTLYDQAVGIPQLDGTGKQTGWLSEPNTTAGIWFSKAQMGWRERVSVEVTDLEAIVVGLGGNVAALRAARAAVPAEEG